MSWPFQIRIGSAWTTVEYFEREQRTKLGQVRRIRTEDGRLIWRRP